MGSPLIRSRHQPFEVAALTTAPVCGVLLFLFDARPASVQLSMPLAVQVGWEVSLVVVGVGGLLGVLWPGRFSTGLGVELSSLLVLATITVMYAVASVAVADRQSIAETALLAAVPAGALWRSAQIAIELRRLARASRPASL